MKRYVKKEILKNLENIATSAGVISFWKNAELLSVSKTVDLKATLSNIMAAGKENEEIFKMVSLASDIEIHEAKNLFETLLIEKLYYSDDLVTQKNILDFKDNLAYLAIDFNKVPFLKVEDNTQSNNFFIGPFLNRFFLHDYLTFIADNYRLPLCDTEDYPCDRYKTKCDGFCLKTAFENASMFKDNYIFVDLKKEKHLENEIENLLDNLDFVKAELLKRELKLRRKFNKYLLFYHCTKRISKVIDWLDYKVEIDKGMIKTIFIQNSKTSLSIDQPQYRDNEVLAINKNSLKEAWIIFDFLYNNEPDYLNMLYDESKKYLNSKWSD